ncbi:hypothetical protein QR98_0045390 [Sarcoptes scabiei]|uniref:Uncharacterized protein n=1 Tax=Sarcoptes scabiei TaxID=52283 RepID=A0A132A512_SARSC|nr:hypothetical protein QR98_0045390 [Sarcoptes scabiei]
MSRIRLHKHLFTSLLFHAVISALLKWHLLDGLNNPDYLLEKQQRSVRSSSNHSYLNLFKLNRLPSFCLILSILLRYFRSTNYLWMFNEALYLHQLIKHAFSQPSLRLLIILAYSLPFITTTSYIFARTVLVQNFHNQTTYSSDPIDVKNETMTMITIASSSSSTTSIPRMEESILDRQSIINNSAAIDHGDRFRTIWSDVGDQLNRSSSSSSLSGDAVNEIDSLLFKTKRSEIKINGKKIPSDPFDKLENQQQQQNRLTNFEYLFANDPTNVQYDSDYIDSFGDYNNINTDFVEEEGSMIEVDHCWLIPSSQPWHEWIINGPNLAILVVSDSYHNELKIYYLFC